MTDSLRRRVLAENGAGWHIDNPVAQPTTIPVVPALLAAAAREGSGFVFGWSTVKERDDVVPLYPVAGAVAQVLARQLTAAAPAADGVDRDTKVLRRFGDGQELRRFHGGHLMQYSAACPSRPALPCVAWTLAGKI